MVLETVSAATPVSLELDSTNKESLLSKRKSLVAETFSVASFASSAAVLASKKYTLSLLSTPTFKRMGVVSLPYLKLMVCAEVEVKPLTHTFTLKVSELSTNAVWMGIASVSTLASVISPLTELGVMSSGASETGVTVSVADDSVPKAIPPSDSCVAAWNFSVNEPEYCAAGTTL